MFYQGSLQEGIATAVQRNKTVVCFVTDGHEESQTWESDFLVDEEISDIIRTEAIALRLNAGSEEAGYLAAIFPLPKSPTLVILKNGELKEYISAGVAKEVFMQRTLNAFGRKRKPTPEPAVSSPTQEQSAASIIAAALSAASSPVIRASNSRGPSPPPYSATAPATAPAPSTQSPTSTSPPTTADQPESQSSASAVAEPTPASSTSTAESTTESTEQPTTQQPTTQALLAERAARIKALRAEEDQKAHKAREAAAAAAAAAKKANPSAPTPASTATTTRQSEHATAIRKQRAAETAERNRILQQIQDDKQARRQRAADRSLSKQTVGSVAASLAAAPASSIDRAKNTHMAALQVRMEDGSSIRSRFSRESTLADHVRRWVSEERAARNLPDVAYGFKVLLAPLPNRMVEVAEEHQSLADLGLAPSATLILVVHGDAVAAYAAPAGVWGYIVALYTWFMALVCSFLGIGGAAPAVAADAAADQDGSAVAAEASGKEDAGQADAEEVRRRRQQAASRIHGFDGGNDEPRSDHQLYNGNSTNFEPRRDDDE